MVAVSFLITVYNKTPFLPHVVAGLASQMGDFEREWIFVEDGSTDGSAEMLADLTAGWQNCQVVRQANSGPAAAFNAGLQRASGDVIKPVDGDDRLTPWATEALLDAMAESGLPVAFGAMNRRRAYDPTLDLRAAHVARGEGAHKAPPVVRTLMDSLRTAQTNPSAMAAQSDIVRRAGGCDPGVFIQDYSLELRLAALTDFACIDETVHLEPVARSGRLTNNQAQILHDLNLAMANLLDSHPELPAGLRRLALKRAARRSWLWAQRRQGEGLLSREHLRCLAADLALVAPTPERIRRTCEVFQKEPGIRRCAPVGSSGTETGRDSVASTPPLRTGGQPSS